MEEKKEKQRSKRRLADKVAANWAKFIGMTAEVEDTAAPQREPESHLHLPNLKLPINNATQVPIFHFHQNKSQKKN